MEKLTPEQKEYWVRLRDDLQDELVRLAEENKRIRGAIKAWAEHVRWAYLLYLAPPHIRNLLDIAEENGDE